MGLCKNRMELARYAAKHDVQSLTGNFLETYDCDPCSRASGSGDEGNSAPEAQGAFLVTKSSSSDDDMYESAWGEKNWGIENVPASEFWDNLHLTDEMKKSLTELINTASGDTANRDEDLARLLITAVPGNFSYNKDDTVTDIRYSRLIRRLDMTEWIAIPNKDILYCVRTESADDKHETPLGQTTVWVNANALIHHSRVKTAKSFVRGEIARRMRNMDFDPDLEGLMKVFFDVDAEDAYSSNRGNC